MGAPGSFSNTPAGLAEWLPLLGSIVQALRSASEDLAAKAEPDDQARRDQALERPGEANG